MQSVSQPDVPHVLLSTGVDWITATANKGESRISQMEYARHERDRLIESGVPIKQGYRLGYYGWQVDGFFYGTREGGSIIVASGDVAQRVFRPVVNTSDHISRLDLQTTVATPTDRPHLGVQAYHALQGGTPSKVRVKNVTLITSHPQGETVTLGKRASDQYGRIYDKATEAQLGEARSVWRYEVELKRSPANAVAARLCQRHPAEADTARLVWDWFDARGVSPIYPRAGFSCLQERFYSDSNRSVLTWFEESLSITVGRAVRRHGLERVLEALGLATLVDVKRKE